MTPVSITLAKCYLNVSKIGMLGGTSCKVRSCDEVGSARTAKCLTCYSGDMRYASSEGMKLRPLPMKVAISFVKAKSVLLGQFFGKFNAAIEHCSSAVGT